MVETVPITTDGHGGFIVTTDGRIFYGDCYRKETDGNYLLYDAVECEACHTSIERKPPFDVDGIKDLTKVGRELGLMEFAPHNVVQTVEWLTFELYYCGNRPSAADRLLSAKDEGKFEKFVAWVWQAVKDDWLLWYKYHQPSVISGILFGVFGIGGMLAVFVGPLALGKWLDKGAPPVPAVYCYIKELLP